MAQVQTQQTSKLLSLSLSLSLCNFGCFNFHAVFVPLRFDDVRGAEAPGGLALSSQQVLGSLHVVRQPGSEGSD